MTGEIGIFTPRIEPSRLKDGTVVWVATLEEMPGIVCEAGSRKAVVEELIATVEHLRESVGLRVVGFRTKAMSDWTWERFRGGERLDTIRSGPLRDDAPSTVLPSAFHETKSLAGVG